MVNYQIKNAFYWVKNMDNEVIETVLEFNIKVQTNKGKEKIIRIFDINHIGSSLA